MYAHEDTHNGGRPYETNDSVLGILAHRYFFLKQTEHCVVIEKAIRVSPFDSCTLNITNYHLLVNTFCKKK